MKFGFLVLAMLILSTALWAQGEGVGNCTSWVHYVDDRSCGDGCATGYFYAPSTSSDYRLRCGMTGCQSFPEYCHYTVELSPRSGGGVIASCDNVGSESCDTNPPEVDNITLQEDVEYQIVVCLDGCFTHPCTDCIGCVVRGLVCRP